MPTETGPDLELDIAHVLFVDVVGYSKLLSDEQRIVLDELNHIIRSTAEFRKAEAQEKLIRLPTAMEWRWYFSIPRRLPFDALWRSVPRSQVNRV